jgi:hypothetical protein
MSCSHKARQRCTYVLAIACSLSCFSCGDCVERPSVTSLAPTSATAGSSGLVLVVNGNHFQRTSTVNWNGMPRTTTFVSGHQLMAAITAADLAEPTAVEVTVFSPPQSRPVKFGTNVTSSATSSVKADCVGGTSNVLPFAINP